MPVWTSGVQLHRDSGRMFWQLLLVLGLLLLTFSLDKNFLGQGCLWTFSASCLQTLRLINDRLYCQIVQFCCQLCSAAQEGVLHLSFTLICTGLEMFPLLSYFPSEFLICCLCTLFCNLTDWKCLLFAKKRNLFDTWSLNKIHFIILFLFLGQLVFYLEMLIYLLLQLFFNMKGFL